MINDKVKIVKAYCADEIYVGLNGIIIEEFSDLQHSKRIKVKIPKDDKRYYLGDKIIFPLHCLEKQGKKKRNVTKKPDICQCLEPEFRWFDPLIETVENEDEWVLICRKCLKPKYKKDL